MSHFIDGDWCRGSGNAFHSVDPSTGVIVWSGFSATPLEIDQTIRASRQALVSWRSLSVEVRAVFLKRFSEIVQKNESSLAEQISIESGKPLWDAKGEVCAIVGKIELTIQAQQMRCESFTKNNAITRFKPHGVIAVLGPFNFPGHLPNGQIIPALLAGNTVIFKPSEYTPGVAELMLRYWIEAGIPKGVLQMLQGKRETGDYLAQHANIDGLFFTGSASVGRLLMESYAQKPEKILAVEMGGNNPLIVWDPCDIEAAVIGIIQSSFISAGQRCNAARRLILPQNQWGDLILEKLVEQTAKIKVGSYRDRPEPFIGSLISAATAEQVLEIQETMIQSGASVLLKMKRLDSFSGLVTPGILGLSAIDHKDVEIFAPLLQVYRVTTFDAALAFANETRYGLAAALFCDEKNKYELFWQQVHAGVLHWNQPTTAASGSAPFGGIGWSGNHRPAGYFMIDSCCAPIASLESPLLTAPAHLPPGINLT